MTSIAAATPTAPRPADVEVRAWATQADERQTLPPITCTPWCVDGDGHPNEIGREDQWCYTGDAHIPASLHDPVKMNDGTTVPGWVSVYGQAWHHGRAPEIHLGQDEDAGMQLTVSEARQVAAALVTAADMLGAR